MNPQVRWLVWLSAVLAGFFGLEVRALRRHEPGGTLSEVLRLLVGVHPRARRRWLLIPVFVAFLGWFGVHILSEPVHTVPWDRKGMS